jgi:hypothetical protein
MVPRFDMFQGPGLICIRYHMVPVPRFDMYQVWDLGLICIRYLGLICIRYLVSGFDMYQELYHLSWICTYQVPRVDMY